MTDNVTTAGVDDSLGKDLLPYAMDPADAEAQAVGMNLLSHGYTSSLS